MAIAALVAVIARGDIATIPLCAAAAAPIAELGPIVVASVAGIAFVTATKQLLVSGEPIQLNLATEKKTPGRNTRTIS